MKFHPVKIGEVLIEQPFTIPSGIITTTSDIIKKFAQEIPQLGFLTTKSIGIAKEEGVLEPIYCQISIDSFLNRVKLANPGKDLFAEELKEIFPLPNGKKLNTSIFGGNKEEFVEVAKTLAPYSDLLELNLSCPHAEKYGAVFGKSAELTAEVVNAVCNAVEIPVIAKLTPSAQNIGDVAKAAVSAGADAIAAINTVGPFNTEELSGGIGSLSGRAIKIEGLRCVKEIRKAIKEPVIVMGGISGAYDVFDYKKAEADLFGIGSAFTNLTTANVKECFNTLGEDLEYEVNCSESLTVDRWVMRPKEFTIERVIELSEDLRIFEFDRGISAEPGQYVFLQIMTKEGKREKPFSVFNDSPLALLVKKAGCFTSELYNFGEGDSVFVRGSYGNAFPQIDAMENLVLIGGGTGIAPLYFYVDRISKEKRKVYETSKEAVNKTKVFFGAKTKNQINFLRFDDDLCDVYFSTEDGSLGFEGTVISDLIAGHDIGHQNPHIVICGPEKMSYKAFELSLNKTTLGRIYISVERYMKCGVGICGSCSMDGERVCVDGTIYDGKRLKESKDFGIRKRDKTGARIPI